MEKKEWGFVLSGGGAKGAYEIGVWKAIRELKLEKRITAVSGTSVGSLNAVLFAQGNYEKAEQIWSTISMEQILSPKELKAVDIKEIDEEVKSLLVQEVMPHVPKPIRVIVSWIKNIDHALCKLLLPAYLVSFAKKSFPIYTAMKLVPIFLTCIHQFLSITSFQEAFQVASYIFRTILGDGLFSQDGLEAIIHQNVDLDKIRKSKIAIYMHTYNVSKLQEETFYIDEKNLQDLTTIMLASSAIPIIYEDVLLHGDKYIDGGMPLIGNNVPVNTLYDKGYRNLIVVGMDEDMDEIEGYEGSRIYLVKPKKSLGGAFCGTLNFQSNYTKKLIKKGYEDAMALLKEIQRE
ncbi:MAG: patatin-like phospholipase family protein [Erysipelotrichaceae bacterium]|nr:patatin-like phospholipase family protein [Erysipelotrichaceae bacterium]